MQDEEVDALIPLLYEELHRRASRLVRGHRGSVQASSLVQEAFVKLSRHEPERWRNAVHFRAAASRAMRQVLIDRARRRTADKRGGQQVRVTLPDLAGAVEGADLIDVAEALERLAEARPRAGRVAELRVLGGLELEEIAEWLEASLSTVKRDWRLGRAFLIANLGLGDATASAEERTDGEV